MTTIRFSCLDGAANCFYRLRDSKWFHTISHSFSNYFGINTELETVVLDGNYYSIVKEYMFFGEHYFMLICETDPSDMFFRKLLIENGEEYFVGLNDEAELNRLLSAHAEEIVSIWKEWWSDAPQLNLLFEK